MGKYLFNKPVLVIVAAVAFGLKALLADYELPADIKGEMGPLQSLLRMLFFGSLIHIVTVVVFGLLGRNKRENWWDNKPGELFFDRVAEYYWKALIVTLPVAVYGGIIFIAIYQSWASILALCVWVAIMWTVQYFREKKLRVGVKR